MSPTHRPEAAPDANRRRRLNGWIANRAWDLGHPFAEHRPVELHLQLVSGCNLDCYMCSEHLRRPEDRHGRGLQVLSDHLIDLIADEVWPYSTHTEIGVGGEPMLHPRFDDIVERAHAAGQRLEITTNATLLTTERRAAVVAGCVQSLEISMDGARPETYERIRRGARFESVLANIRRLNEIRLATPAAERTRLTLCFVLMRSNVAELPAFIELASRLEADAVAAWPVIGVTPEGRADQLPSSMLNPSGEVAEILERARRRSQELGITLDLPGLGDAAATPKDARRSAALDRQARKRLPCHMPTAGLYVMYDGSVHPCCNPHVQRLAPIGQLGVDDFEVIWNGNVLQNLRRDLSLGEAPPACQSCPIVNPHDPSTTTADEELQSFTEHYRDHGPPQAELPAPSKNTVEGILTTGIAELLDNERARIEQAARERRDLVAEREGLSEHIEQLRDEQEDLLRQREQLIELRTSYLEERESHLEERELFSKQTAELLEERRQMSLHITALERILDKIRGRRIYRALCAVKDRLTMAKGNRR